MAREVRPQSDSRHSRSSRGSGEARSSTDRDSARPLVAGDLTVFPDAPVESLRGGLGEHLHALGPGPGGRERPIPLFVQLLDPAEFEPSFLDDPASIRLLEEAPSGPELPAGLPPLVHVLAADDPDNPTGRHLLARHAHTEGASELLSSAIEGGLRLSITDFLDLSTTLTRIQVFLHDHHLPGIQWSGSSILLARPGGAPSSAGEPGGQRFDFTGAGLVPVRDLGDRPGAIPDAAFPPESREALDGRPDPRALDLGADVHLLGAFLEETLARATSFEELSLQARKMRDRLHREALRRGETPASDRVEDKEQEILDHLYTLRLRIEAILARALAPRAERPDAGELHEEFTSLRESARAYESALESGSFEPVNLFGERLRRYVPYRVELEPDRVNHYEDSRVSLRGRELPVEVTRITLGDHENPLKILEAGPTCVEFQVPRGFPAGEHALLLNNRRTDRTLLVVAPGWQEIRPARQRQPWAGCGDLEFTILGESLPRRVEVTLAPLELESRDGPERPRREALRVELLGTEADETRETGEDEPDLPNEEGLRVVFSGETAVGAYSVLVNGFDTGLEITVDEPLPDPVIDSVGEDGPEVLNHREQLVPVHGRNLHPDMLVDLGEGAPAEIEFVPDPGTARRGHLRIPGGLPAGACPLRVNRRDTGHRLQILTPAWEGLEPERLTFHHRDREARAVEVRGQFLPPLDRERGDIYRLRSVTGKWVESGIVSQEALPVDRPERPESHRLMLSPALGRGSPRLYFGEVDTGLRPAIRRGLSPLSRAALAVGLVLLLLLVTDLVVDRFRPVLLPPLKMTAFNFGDDPVMLEGERLESVILESVDDPSRSHPIELERLEPDSPRAFLRPLGLPPGRYRLIPVSGSLRGEPAGEAFEVLSPAFALDPLVVLRGRRTVLELEADGAFPLEEIRYLILRPVEDPATATPGSHQRQRSLDEVPLKFRVEPGGQITIPAGALGVAEEGRHEIYLAHDFTAEALRAAPLDAEVTASGEALRLEVLGPRVDLVKPSPATLSLEGSLSLELEGERLPTGTALHLIPESDADVPDAATFPLLSAGEGRYEGPASPGVHRLAWGAPGASRETLEPIPSHELVVLPASRVTSIEPAKLDPRKVRQLHLRGDNLAGLDAVKFLAVPPGVVLEVPLSSETVRGGEGEVQELEIPTPALEPGSYRIEPGGEATVKILDDCRELHEAMLRGERAPADVIDCLGETPDTDELAREVADTLFDRGHLTEALGLYRNLGGPMSRFRVEFITREGSSPASPSPPGPFPGLPGDPWHDAARAMGWVSGSETGPFRASPGAPWDLHHVEGRTTAEPGRALAAFERAVTLKARAAGEHEHAPFEPSLVGCDRAFTESRLRSFEKARPLEALADLETTILADPEALERLGEPTRSRLYLALGHAVLWYRGDATLAREHLARVDPASHLAGLASRYAVALDPTGEVASSGRTPSAPASPDGETAWFAAFIDVYPYYHAIRQRGSFNVLVPPDAPAAHLSASERRDGRDLQAALEELEALPASFDPVAHHALLHHLLRAREISWPRSKTGSQAKDHRRALEALDLAPEAAARRDLFLLEAEVEPLAPAQIHRMPLGVWQEHRQQLTSLSKHPFPGALEARVQALVRKLEPARRLAPR